MSSFEWMELQTLTGDINAARSRLAQARASKDQRLIRSLETEIAAAEGRRDRLLTYISTHLAGTPEPTAEPAAASAADLAAPAGEMPPAPPAEPAPDLPVDSPVASAAAAPAIAAEDHSVEGDSVVWEQLTPGDIERAQSEIGVRRAEMLARHGEEMRTLEAEQAQIESLESAVQTFLRRFNPAAAASSPEAAIVKLGQERELRAQGRG